MVGIVTLVCDGILPFFIISVMNAMIIRAIRSRHRELSSFKDESDASDQSTSGQNWALAVGSSVSPEKIVYGGT